MRTVTTILLDEDRQLITRTEPGISSVFAMQQHLRALAQYPVMRLPPITPNAMWKAVQMGLKPKKEAA